MIEWLLLAVVTGGLLYINLRTQGPEVFARASTGWIGERVRFAHPTERGVVIEGCLVSVGDSPLSVAWVSLTVELDDGQRVQYAVHARELVRLVATVP